MSPMAKVTMSLQDVGTSVPSFPGVACGMAGPFLKGPIGQLQLVPDQSDFLKKWTRNGRVEPGMDNCHFSVLAAMKKTDEMWLSRAANNALFGGAVIKTKLTGANAQVAAGMSNPESYNFGEGEALLLYGANQGEWNNDIAFKLTTYEESPDYVKEEGAFVIDIFKWSQGYGGVDVYTSTGESHLCSRDSTKRDGYNRRIYVVDVLSGSQYLRATDNLLISGSTQLSQSTTHLKLAHGDDGGAVTDGNMITAVDLFSNRDDVRITILSDGGWATVAYHTEIISIVSDRQDCMAILSIPYANEASADYVNQVVNYRKVDLNLECEYATLFTPHVLIYDKDNDRQVYVSPDGYAMAALSYTAANYGWHYPFAGFDRGNLLVNGLRRTYKSGEMDTIYDAGINPIRNVPGKGIYIWGNRTMFTRPSPRRSTNVMTNLMVVRPIIAETLENWLFNLALASERARVQRVINEALRSYVSKGMYTSASCICDNSNNSDYDLANLRMNVTTRLSPTGAIEDVQYLTVLEQPSSGSISATTTVA